MLCFNMLGAFVLLLIKLVGNSCLPLIPLIQSFSHGLFQIWPPHLLPHSRHHYLLPRLLKKWLPFCFATFSLDSSPCGSRSDPLKWCSLGLVPTLFLLIPFRAKKKVLITVIIYLIFGCLFIFITFCSWNNCVNRV